MAIHGKIDDESEAEKSGFGFNLINQLTPRHFGNLIFRGVRNKKLDAGAIPNVWSFLHDYIPECIRGWIIQGMYVISVSKRVHVKESIPS